MLLGQEILSSLKTDNQSVAPEMGGFPCARHSEITQLIKQKHAKMNADHLDRIWHTPRPQNDLMISAETFPRLVPLGGPADDSNVRSRFADHSRTRKRALQDL
jgi:hypothetical protein